MSAKFSTKKNFKQGISTDDGRRRREAAAVAIRKEKKEESFLKRRNITETEESPQDTSFVSGTGLQEIASPKKPYNILDIPDLMDGLNSGDIDKQLAAVRGFRKLLSTENNPPVRQCIDCGAVSAFVYFLQKSDCPKIQFESAWALTNIASSDETKVVVDYGAIPHLVALLTSNDADIREQSAWCLGNIAGDSPALRDIVLNNGALMPLLANIAQPANLTLLRNCTWSLSNMCRGKPAPPLSIISPAIPALGAILVNHSDQSTIVDAMWALSYISDGENNRIQSVVNASVLPNLVQALASNKAQLIVPALRTLGNIVTGADSHTQAVLDANVFAVVPHLLEHPKKNIRKETCWMLSNIAAGTRSQINQLVAEREIIPRILANLAFDKEWDVRKEACWVICNILSDAKNTPSHIVQLVEFGAIKQLCDILNCNEVHIIVLVLNALEIILLADDENGSYKDLIDEAEGIEKIEDLQNHAKESVYKKASEILEKFFGGEEVEGGENIAPTSNGNVFAFGVNNASTAGAFPQKTFDFNMASAAKPNPLGTSQQINNQAGAHQFSF